MFKQLKDDFHEFVASRFSRFGILKSYVVLFMDIAISVVMSGCTILLLQPVAKEPLSTQMAAKATIACFIAALIAFLLFHTHNRIIRHTTMRDLLVLAIACFVKALIELGLFMIPIWGTSFFNAPNVYLFSLLIEGGFTFIALVVVRVLMITVYDSIMSDVIGHGEKLIIYSIGKKAYSLIPFLQQSNTYKLAGFLNHDSDDKSLSILNYKVWCFRTEKDLEVIYNRTHCKFLLFPSLKDLQREQDRVVNFCHKHNVKMLIAPNLDTVHANNGVLKLGIREINIEDLLGREEIKIDMQLVGRFFFGKTVMVTGAAGSIGSELCRQLASVGVAKLILFDNAETPMHNLRLELDEKYEKDSPNGPKLEIYPVIGDVRYNERLKMCFSRHHPDIVFHAAAYKHVPLMEENPCEAILVNILGSKNVADACVKYGASNMIMISTDKAVNPTNVMGATKRAAELYVQSLGKKIQAGEVFLENGEKATTKFTTTRFGNVLGSNGSVIPRFRQQIQHGGPLTVTSSEINRYFMSIPEASRLVLEAATMGMGCDIFVFDMGEPVKIIDLAHKMIELAGYKPDDEIKIAITGLRPGEKIYEEVLAKAEDTLETNVKKIRIAKVREADYDTVCQADEELKQLSLDVDIDGAVKRLKQLVPEFKSQNSVFSKFDTQP